MRDFDKTLWFVLLTALTAACSSDGNSSGSGGNAGAGGGASNCASRCTAVAQKCGLNAGDCSNLCTKVSEHELSCMETTNCNQAAYDQCIAQGSGGSPGGGGSGGVPAGGGSGGSGGSTTGCNAFKCTSTAAGECAFQPCMSTDTGQNYCYAQAASETECPSGTTATQATVDGSQRWLCVPSGCPQPKEYIP